jgi:hypothetical protein
MFFYCLACVGHFLPTLTPIETTRESPRHGLRPAAPNGAEMRTLAK